MTYNVGHHISFAETPAPTRESQGWPVGLSVDFVTLADEPKIFLPKISLAV